MQRVAMVMGLVMAGVGVIAQTQPATKPATLPATVPGTMAATVPATRATTAPAVKIVGTTKPGVGEMALAGLHDEKIRAAMAKGAEALLKLMSNAVKNTEWKRPPASLEQDKAELAMGTYALLVMYKVSGDERLKFDSKEMAPLVEAVCGMRSHYTYCAAWQALAMSMLPMREEIRKDMEAVRDQLWAGCMDGAYTYELPVISWTKDEEGKPKPVVEWAQRGQRTELWDNSNGQYGLLGMWACSDAGLEVPEKYWQQINAHWRGCQQPAGEWPYTVVNGKGYASIYGLTTSMTAGGVANLIIANDKLDTSVKAEAAKDKALEDGIARLEKDLWQVKQRMGWDLYMSFAIERAALATGMKRMGNIDWFKEGAGLILQKQEKNGIWEYQKSNIAGTAYALLFLARGRAPIVFNKLEYAGNWGARPRDAARVTKYLAGNTESLLNWQLADLRTPEDGAAWLDDAPILMITGRGDPKFTLADCKKLKQFVDAGGLIFSSADEGDAAFTSAIKQLYAPLICGKKYEMRALPADHPLYKVNAKVTNGTLLGLSNGVRELWVHSPEDMAGAWQANNFDAAKGGGGMMWDVPVNLVSYVSGREALRCRLDPLSLQVPGTFARQVTVGRLMFGGNDNPEPGSWARYAKIAGARWGVDLQAVPVKMTDLGARISVVHVTGTGTFAITPAEKKLLAAYLRGGGKMIVEGSDEGFLQSFGATVKEALDNEFQFGEVKTGHPVLMETVEGGAEMKELKARRWVSLPENSARKLGVRELQMDGHAAVLMFTGDVSSGFLGTNTWGIYGWSPATSEVLMWNALVYLRGK